ncbi:MAG TPA: hypothetical protein VKS79_05170 [Gemmataceae bacterium]|nr:hypothetical protein [Gemmataceae bacterium]
MRALLITLALIAGLLSAAVVPLPAWAHHRGGYGNRIYSAYGQVNYGGYRGDYHNSDYGFGPTIPNPKFESGHGRDYYARYRVNYRNELATDYGFGPSSPR